MKPGSDGYFCLKPVITNAEVEILWRAIRGGEKGTMYCARL